MADPSTGGATYVSVASEDGTTIVASVTGGGPPIVLVHGTAGSDLSWALVRPHLDDRHTVYAMQRRGRGRSGDAADHSLEREFEDIVALVDHIDAPVALVGHSFGATCCLAASIHTSKVSRLVLYEPTFDFESDEPMLEGLDALVERGDRDEAVALFMRAVGLTEEEILGLRSSPSWEERAAAAHTLSREERASAGYAPSADALARLTVPTLLLVGSESPSDLLEGAERLHGSLPHNTLHVLEGQAHAANVTAPDLLAAEIAAFVGA